MKKLTNTALFGLFAILIYKCPLKLLFGIDCPGCGMTRAFLSFISLDIKSAFEYHPLFLIAAIEIVYLFGVTPVKLCKKKEMLIVLLTMLLFAIVWFYRQFVI